ncbi:hypothetical protein BDV95DRAFT_608163 [Massariosphaeria phaeospora]|uniref:Uncharacterized protein n=1 Tax=Massariosphaeria phaeospora TaxID=100035 RepID=A0A7C8IBS3_9PLEO|nr:hypothetical protein BDV95DRAFT_608163 [Massariosphaeria phaeospora]
MHYLFFHRVTALRALGHLDGTDLEEAILELACNTPLPEDTDVDPTHNVSAPTAKGKGRERPQQRPQAPDPKSQKVPKNLIGGGLSNRKHTLDTSGLFSGIPMPPKRARRTRPAPIQVFFDPRVYGAPVAPAQNPAMNNRAPFTPLSASSSNMSYTPTPRNPEDSFGFNPADPLYEDQENH